MRASDPPASLPQKYHDRPIRYKSFVKTALAAAGVSPHVLGNPQYSTRFVEALWRRRKPVLPVPAAVCRQRKLPPPPNVCALVQLARLSYAGRMRLLRLLNDLDPQIEREVLSLGDAHVGPHLALVAFP